MTRFLSLIALVVLCGCTTLRLPNYIKGDHPYAQKMYGDYDHIVAVVRGVLVHNGWKVRGQAVPSDFERPGPDAPDTDRDLVLFTDIKQHSMFLYSSYTHLNMFIHALPDGAWVEVRYGKVTPIWFKQFQSTRNDRLGRYILQDIAEELVGGN